MPADSSAVDAAVVAKLAGDSTLLALMTDGVFVDIAGKDDTRFVIVSQASHFDDYVFDGRVVETFSYLVKAVDRSTSGATVKTAAARIDTLLQDVALTISGYGHLLTRRSERVRYTEVDSVDQDIRWQHRGGLYQVVVAPLS
uniref:Uncharacterized protein n=1 Tax=viral metagenome TaxID=1070528 RepID=A0A6M3JPL6_9ZZZZ